VESTAAEKERMVARAEATALDWERRLRQEQDRLTAAAAELESGQAAAKAAGEAAARDRRLAEGARRALAGIEAALEEREAQLRSGWEQLHAATAALKDEQQQQGQGSQQGVFNGGPFAKVRNSNSYKAAHGKVGRLAAWCNMITRA
jgi:chromosome segregation ATPase